MTYDSFVSNSEEIEEYLGGELKEENTIAIIENNAGHSEICVATFINAITTQDSAVFLKQTKLQNNRKLQLILVFRSFLSL